jgi:hypothetical protein
MPVPNAPGSTSTTRTPSGSTSIRSASVTASSACLLAEYQPNSGSDTRPATELTLTMRPSPRSRIRGRTSRAIRTGATTLVSSWARTCSSLTSSTAPDCA